MDSNTFWGNMDITRAFTMVNDTQPNDSANQLVPDEMRIVAESTVGLPKKIYSKNEIISKFSINFFWCGKFTRQNKSNYLIG